MSAAERAELQSYLDTHGIEPKLNELLNELVGGGFELILHGPHTQTTGPHLHLGHRYQSSHRILFENGRGYQAVD